MSKQPAHQWFLVIESEAKKRFDTLTFSEKQGVFRALRQLLLADNPYALPFVEALKDPKFGNLRKFRAGDYRIFFGLDVNPVERYQHRYRGTLVIVFIRHRSKAY